jgi:hypothetical protein
MRFKQFITEAVRFDPKRFLQDCHPCLSQLNLSKDPEQDPSYKVPFRGMSPTTTAKTGWDIIQHTKHRKPKDTPLLVHNAMNEVFKKKFGWNARNGVFVTGSDMFAGTFSTVHAVFPIGEFKFLWSPQIEDVYGDVVEPVLGDDWEEDWADRGEIHFQDDLLGYPWSTKDFAEALKSMHEIMLSCESYYAFLFDSVFFNRTIMPLISEEYGK